MYIQQSLLVTALTGAATVSAFDIPSNLLNFYNNHKSGNCQKILADGFSVGVNGGGGVQYCGDIPNAIFLHSTNNGGEWADMDIDCDGANLGAGKCANDPSGQGQTAFQDTVASYNVGISDLDANKIPYVVFGNSGATPSFDPQSVGMQPLSVMAVVCNNSLHYGIWGDVNGATSTGEASISLADLCFPNENLTGDNGHDPRDVLYVGFTGNGAVPGAKGADWTASDGATFENSIRSLGDKLVASVNQKSRVYYRGAARY